MICHKKDWRQTRLKITPPSQEEERKRRVLEAEKKRAEEAKRKELYELMKVSPCLTKIDRWIDFWKKEAAFLMTLFLLVFSTYHQFWKKESEPEIEVIKEEDSEIKVNIKNSKNDKQ